MNVNVIKVNNVQILVHVNVKIVLVIINKYKNNVVVHMIIKNEFTSISYILINKYKYNKHYILIF